MPRGDGSGPNGMGPMTGRGAGYCAGYSTPGFANPMGRGFGGGGGFGGGRGRGFGFGGGRGGGWRNAYYGPAVYPGPVGPAWQPAAIPQEQELEMLKAQATQMETAMSQLRQRITELEGQTDK